MRDHEVDLAVSLDALGLPVGGLELRVHAIVVDELDVHLARLAGNLLRGAARIGVLTVDDGVPHLRVVDALGGGQGVLDGRQAVGARADQVRAAAEGARVARQAAHVARLAEVAAHRAQRHDQLGQAVGVVRASGGPGHKDGGLVVLAHELRQIADVLGAHAADLGSPLGRLRGSVVGSQDVVLEVAGRILALGHVIGIEAYGVRVQVIPVDQALLAVKLQHGVRDA